jgi:hypothetical protein
LLIDTIMMGFMKVVLLFILLWNSI